MNAAGHGTTAVMSSAQRPRSSAWRFSATVLGADGRIGRFCTAARESFAGGRIGRFCAVGVLGGIAEHVPGSKSELYELARRAV